MRRRLDDGALRDSIIVMVENAVVCRITITLIQWELFVPYGPDAACITTTAQRSLAC